MMYVISYTDAVMEIRFLEVGLMDGGVTKSWVGGREVTTMSKLTMFVRRTDSPEAFHSGSTVTMVAIYPSIIFPSQAIT